MSSITVTRTLSQTRASVWAALADTAGIHRFHPLVERSPLHAGTPAEGVGSERTCHFYDGNHIKERVLRSDPMRAIEVEIYEGSMPLRSATAIFELTPVGDARTQLAMTMRYEPKFGVVGRVMDSLMMRRKFTGMMTVLLAALDEHLRTGRPIDRSFSLDRAA